MFSNHDGCCTPLRITLLLLFLILLPSRVVAETAAATPGRESGKGTGGCASDFQSRLWISSHGSECDTCGTSGAMLWLDSVPFGAVVHLGEERLGVTPFWLDISRIGGESVSLSYPGYHTRRIQLSERPGPMLEVRLSPVGAMRGSRADDREGGPSGFLNARSLQWSLLLVSAGSAVAGLHFKDRADEAYEQYLHTGHSSRMRETFDRAEKNDTYALGCWIAAEVSLVGFLYLLATSPDDHGWGLATAFHEINGQCAVGVRCSF